MQEELGGLMNFASFSTFAVHPSFEYLRAILLCADMVVACRPRETSDRRNLWVAVSNLMIVIAD